MNLTDIKRKHPPKTAGDFGLSLSAGRCWRLSAGPGSGPAFAGAGSMRRDRALLRDPVPGEVFVEPALRRLGDAAEHIGEPGLRIDIVELGGADQRVNRRRAHAAAVGTAEQP